MLCSLCAAENPNDGRYCLKCGALLQGQRGAPPEGTYSAPVEPFTGTPQNSPKAIASLICGLIIIFFPSSIAAIILGHLALADIRRSGGRLKGTGMATAGLVLGYSGVTIVPILIIAATLIPGLLRIRVAGNEGSALRSIRLITNAEITFDDSYANGFSPTLEALGGAGSGQDTCDRAGLISDALASGQKDGYRFRYVPTGPPVFPDSSKLRGCTRAGSQGFELFADPVTRGTSGRRSFYVDQTGVIRVSATGPATPNSRILRRLQLN
jgi:type IV pilus assembly protein PilA